MAGKSDYFENAVLNALCNVPLAVANVYVALFTTLPSEAGAGGVEPAGGAYARQAVTFAAPAGGAMANTADVLFPQASANWGTVIGFGLCDALAANGTNCPVGQATLGIDAGGNAEGCYDPNTYRPSQINFVYGGSATTNIDAVTVNNVWRAHAHTATVTEVACWTDAGTVSLTIRRSDGTNMHAALSCSTTGASTTTITAASVIAGQGLGFVTASVAGVKNLSVSIKYTRGY